MREAVSLINARCNHVLNENQENTDIKLLRVLLVLERRIRRRSNSSVLVGLCSDTPSFYFCKTEQVRSEEKCARYQTKGRKFKKFFVFSKTDKNARKAKDRNADPNFYLRLFAEHVLISLTVF